MNRVKVSIIVVNHNGSRHLPELFASIRALDYPQDKLEVIFFDNGSVDDSLDVVRHEYPGASIIDSPENLGFAAPHRIAAQKAKGEILAFLNNDMRVHPGWIAEGLSCLKSDQGVVCAASRILSWDGRKLDFNGGSLQYLGYAEQYQQDKIHDGDQVLFPCGGAMFILKEVFTEAGCFDDDYFAVFEDVDLGWRLWLMGYQVVMAGRSITYHRGHATLDTRNEAQKRYLMHRNALVTIIKNYEEKNLDKLLPAAISLALKRGLLFLGVDKSQFYFWEKNPAEISLDRNTIEGLLHLVVLDDVLEDFENIVRKRELVQAKRVRQDAEILHLFQDPMRNIMGFKEYLWHETALMGFFRLHELFNCKKRYQNKQDHGLDLARQELSSIRREINRLTMANPPLRTKQAAKGDLMGKFNRKRKDHGLFAALRHSIGYCLAMVRKKD